MKHRIFSDAWSDYELLDAGGGKKLERWGKIVTIRPDINAYFASEIPFSTWNKQAHFIFEPQKGVFGRWKTNKPAPLDWNIQHKEVWFRIFLANTKHTGLFPEQKMHWDFIEHKLKAGQKFLNLFAYSGAASMVALKVGAEVTHVDSSKSALSWAKKNLEINQFSGCKWVHDDAFLFLQREVKRGNKYDLIQMDPPSWGVGLKGSKWKLEDQLDSMISNAVLALNSGGSLILSTYSAQIDDRSLKEIIELYFGNAHIKSGTLCTKSESGKILEHGAVAQVSLLSFSDD